MPNGNNDLNINVFELQKKKLYLFQQYRHLSFADKFFKIIDSYIQKNYYDTLKKFWSARDIIRSKEEYLSFYARYYLGLIRPIKTNSSDESTEDPTDTTLHIYDAKLGYDTRWIYDDSYEANPFISSALFRAYLRFCYDYSETTWTHDYIIKFAAEWCNQEPSDIKIIFTPTKVLYSLIATTEARQFVAGHKNDEYDMNMPFANCYEFILGDLIKDPKDLNNLALQYPAPDNFPPRGN